MAAHIYLHLGERMWVNMANTGIIDHISCSTQLQVLNNAQYSVQIWYVRSCDLRREIEGVTLRAHKALINYDLKNQITMFLEFG